MAIDKGKMAYAATLAGDPALMGILPTPDSPNALKDIAITMSENPNVRNNFLQALYNKIVMQIINVKTFNNKLNFLKTAPMPLGFTIESAYTNPTAHYPHDPDSGLKSFAKYKPDTKSLYNALNIDRTFPVTLEDAQLQQAFTSWDGLSRMIDSIASAQANAITNFEFLTTKNLIAKGFYTGCGIEVKIDPTADVKEILRQLHYFSEYFQYPSSNYNAYKTLHGEEVTTVTDKPDQYIMLRSDKYVDLNIDTLAGAFNLNKIELDRQVTTFDSFATTDLPADAKGDPKNIVAVICDRSAFMVKDSQRIGETSRNPYSHFTNLIYTLFQVYACVPFFNTVYITQETTP